MNSLSPVFLTAEWRHLAMLNFEIDPKILAPLVPAGTELDFWNSKTYVSIVAFRFLKTRVRGIAFPFHRNFEEINLRFYVRRKADDGWRRAVVFIKEIVPRFAIAFVARTIYNEPYIALPTAHRIEQSSLEMIYSWRFKGKESYLKIIPHGEARDLPEGSHEEFIAEHYWGYTAQRDGSTLEYRVEHPRWWIWDAQTAEWHCDIAALYGKLFLETLSHRPSSAFLAEGSPVKVYKGIRLKL